MTTYRKVQCHVPEDDSSNNHQSTISKFNPIWTIFIQCNEPPNAHQKNVFRHILLFTKNVSVASATIFKVSHKITQCKDN